MLKTIMICGMPHAAHSNVADEIESLRARVTELEAALEKLSRKAPIGDYVVDVYSDLSHGLIVEELDHRAEFAHSILHPHTPFLA